MLIILKTKDPWQEDYHIAQRQQELQKMPLHAGLEKNFREIQRVSGSDMVIRRFKIAGETNTAVVYIDGIINDTIVGEMLHTLMVESLRESELRGMKKRWETNSDVLGLGNLIYRKKPRVWEEIEDDWDDIFPELEVDIIVEVEQKRTGLVSTPVHEESY